MASVIDMARSAVTSDVVQNASRTLGEDSTAVQNTLNSAVPSVLGGMLAKIKSAAGSSEIFSLITSGKYGDTSDLTAAGGVEGLLRNGQSAVSQLFGGKTDRVTDVLSRTGGVKRSSAASLLNLAAPIVMGVLGKQVASRNLDAAGTAKLLQGERDAITRAMPPGMSREIGLDESAAETTRRTHEHRETTYREYTPPKKKRSAAPWLIGGLAALGLLWFLTRDRTPDTVTVDVPPATEQPITVQPDVVMAERARPVVELDAFLTNTTAGETPSAFLVTGVVFEATETDLDTSDLSAVSSLADVLEAHPNARVRIEVHTDNQGDASENRRLSTERAEAIKDALVAEGVSADRITAVGVGGDRPVASNDSEAGRAQNRRVELIVVQR